VLGWTGEDACPYVAVPAFPDYSSDWRLIPRLQLRGSAGFAPASQSSFEDARTEQLRKNKATREKL
jgi:hypothetical protein